MDEARRAVEITEMMHRLASTPAGALLSLVELERLAIERLAVAPERLTQVRQREPR